MKILLPLSLLFILDSCQRTPPLKDERTIYYEFVHIEKADETLQYGQKLTPVEMDSLKVILEMAGVDWFQTRQGTILVPAYIADLPTSYAYDCDLYWKFHKRVIIPPPK